jgi:hypothetical protein
MINYGNKRVLTTIEAKNNDYKLVGNIFSDFENPDEFIRVYANIFDIDSVINANNEKAGISISKIKDNFMYKLVSTNENEITEGIKSLVNDVVKELAETYNVTIEEFVEMPTKVVPTKVTHEHACECGCEGSTENCECEECQCEECK